MLNYSVAELRFIRQFTLIDFRFSDFVIFTGPCFYVLFFVQFIYGFIFEYLILIFDFFQTSDRIAGITVGITPVQHTFIVRIIVFLIGGNPVEFIVSEKAFRFMGQITGRTVMCVGYLYFTDQLLVLIRAFRIDRRISFFGLTFLFDRYRNTTTTTDNPDRSLTAGSCIIGR